MHASYEDSVDLLKRAILARLTGRSAADQVMLIESAANLIGGCLPIFAEMHQYALKRDRKYVKDAEGKNAQILGVGSRAADFPFPHERLEVGCKPPSWSALCALKWLTTKEYMDPARDMCLHDYFGQLNASENFIVLPYGMFQFVRYKLTIVVPR
jgi:hypothetical protein